MVDASLASPEFVKLVNPTLVDHRIYTEASTRCDELIEEVRDSGECVEAMPGSFWRLELMSHLR